MAQDNKENQGQKRLDTTLDPNIALSWMVKQLLNNLQTSALVKVISVSNHGDLSPVGTVVVQPLVQQMTGGRRPISHGEIHNLPYIRIQGGKDAIILDPKPGDIGVCVFCSRDSSGVVSTKKEAPAASFRKFDWADGMYVGGVLNGAPEQYIRFSDAGIEFVTPTNTIKAFVDVHGAAQTSGNVSVGTGATGTFTTPAGQTVTVMDGIIVSIVG